MLDALWWLIVAEIIGLAAFPLAYYLLPRLRDRGFSISKALGLLLIGFSSWLLSVLHIVPSAQPTLWLMLLIMGGLSGRYVWTRRREFKEFVVRERGALIAIEAVFLIFFVGWAVFRSFDPAIDHTEQPMDFAFFNASIRSEFGQPQDPWLSGESISYYYFGYWMMGSVSKLTGIASNISYNLAMALIPALAAVGIFGLVYNMVRAEVSRWVYGIIGAAGAVILVGVAGNLEGVLEFMRLNGMGSQGFYDWVRVDGVDGPNAGVAESWAPQEFWWWFRATRVINTFDGGQGIDYTIQEFPFFSFMLGDMHPHVMAIPFVLMFVAFSWNWLRSPTDRWLVPVSSSNSPDVPTGPGLQGYATLLAMGIVLGGLAFTNMWDGPTLVALLVAVAILKVYQTRGGGFSNLIGGVVPVTVAVLAVAFLLYLPYYLGFTSSLTGIEPVVAATTRPVHTFIVWGLLLVVVAPFVVATFLRTTIRAEWRGTTLVAVLVWALPLALYGFLMLWDEGRSADLSTRFFHILPLAILISMGAHSVLWLAREGEDGGKLFAMVLAVLGMMLLLGPELLFVGDTFSSRMNTVFKLYYQAWVILAAVSGYAIYYWVSTRATVRGWKRALTTVWAGAFVVLLAGSVYYPAAAATSKGSLDGRSATLDGLDFLERSRPAEYRAIEYLKDNVDGDAIMVEAVGEWFDAGLISRSTGVPTVLNWSGHQVQWRGAAVELDAGREDPAEVCRGLDARDAAGFLLCRELDVARIYQTQDVQEARNLLARYDVEYVYVGPRERTKYGTDGLAKFETFMATAFIDGDVAIYSVR